MIKMEVSGLDRLQRKFNKISKTLDDQREDMMENALTIVKDYAVSLAKGRTKGSVKVEIIDHQHGRVYNDTNVAAWSSFQDFGTGLYVNSQGVEEAIRLQGKGEIPWYVHEDMVDDDFDVRYNFPVVYGKDGSRFFVMHGSHPSPYMVPAAREKQQDMLDFVVNALKEQIKEVLS